MIAFPLVVLFRFRAEPLIKPIQDTHFIQNRICGILPWVNPRKKFLCPSSLLLWTRLLCVFKRVSSERRICRALCCWPLWFQHFHKSFDLFCVKFFDRLQCSLQSHSALVDAPLMLLE